MKINKIAIFTPLPPSKTGIADYMVELGMELEKHIKIVYVIGNDVQDSTYIPSNGCVLRVETFLASKDANILPRIYQMGNNLQHEFILKELLKVPGIVVMHDYSMHHLFVELTLARGDETSYRDLMEYNYGEYGKTIAYNRSQGVFNELFQFTMPLNQTIIDTSKAILVHSYESFYRTKKTSSYDKKIFKLAFPYNHEQDNILCNSSQEAKDKLNLPEKKVILASFGFVTPPKQIEFALKALSNIKKSVPDFLYLIVGEVSSAVPIESLLCEYDLEENVKVLGYVDFEELHLYMQATDITINLRYPSAGETSAALYRAMGIGKCCLVFDYSSFSDLPDDTLIKVKLDTYDTTEMEKILQYYISNEDAVKQIEQNAKQYILEKHSVDITAKQYLKAIKNVFCTALKESDA